MMESLRYFLAISISFLVGFILTLWPLPEFVRWFRPEWILLLVIFWSLNSFGKFGVVAAWSVGLLCDILSDTLLGEHALVFALVGYLAIKIQKRFVFFPYTQQIVIILGLLLIDKILLFFIQTSVGRPPAFGLYFITLLTTLLFWPVVASILGHYTRKMKTHNSLMMR